ncbi:MAG: hypothetical protein HY904_01895 [Deltaproteobacteria bacterium]|nr:hypothetical protein [Deltaproteobacteria bacterium]
MTHLLACLLFASALPGATPTAEPPATAGGTLALEKTATTEDALAVVQVAAAMGAAGAVGVAAVFPGLVVGGAGIMLARTRGAAELAVAAPVGTLVGVLLAQAVAAGLAVWGVSFLGRHFLARSLLPPWGEELVRRAGGNPRSVLARSTLGVPWVTPVAGYLAGSMAGVLAGLAVGGPALAAAMVVARAPPGTLYGDAALVLAVGAGVAVGLASQAVLGPLGAVVAYHLGKEPR